MRDKIFRISCLLIALLFNLQDSFGQLTTVNINTNKDSYVNSQLPDQNFGTDTLIKSGTVKPRFLGPFYQRVFTEFDLSSIPPNAVIYSAKIKMKVYSGIYGSNPFRTKLVTSTWSENTITLNNQPSISTDAGDISSSYTVSNDTVSFDVTDMAQRMVYSQISNYGWSIQVLDETYSGLTGATFWSREYSNYIPTLEVKYFLPLTISNVVITHESTAAANDGAINLTVNNGSQSFTYDWYNSSGTLISTSTTSPQITDLNFGWYGLHVTGSLGEELYYAFLIGTQCEEVTINFETSPNYTDNAFLYNLIYGSTNYGDNNYGDYVYLKSQRWTYSGNWMSGKSLLKLNVWMDPAFTVNQADITMYGSAHSTLGGSNDAEFNLVTEEWDQNRVTWNTAPSVSDSIDVNIAATSSSTENKTVDIKEYWNHWKKNNSQNYGMILQLQNFNNYYHEQRYHSPAASITSNRPDVVFKLELIPESYTSMTWDPDTEKGEINIDIQDLCGTHSSPYKYMISNDSISDLTDMYNFINDSVFFGGLDSSDFFNGTTETNFTFSGLESNKYMVSVFDANWVKIWEEQVIVQDTIKFEFQSGLSISNNILSANEIDAKGSIKLYIQNDSDSELSIEPISTGGEQFFGLLEFDSVVANYQSIEHGFYLNEDTVRFIYRGILSSGFQLLNSGSVLKVRSFGDSIFCLIDEIPMQAKAILGEFTYKTGVGMQPQGSAKLFSNNMRFDEPLYSFSTNVNYYDCQNSIGDFSFQLNPTNQGGPYNVIYDVLDFEGNYVIQNGNSVTGIPIPVAINYPNIYKVVFSMNGGGTEERFVTVGYKTEWDQRDVEFTQVPNSYSLLSQGNNEVDFLNAQSSNVLKNVDQGWIQFRPVLNNGVNYFRYTTTNLNVNPTTGMLNEPFIAFVKWQNQRFAIGYKPSNGIFLYSNLPYNTKVLIKYSIVPSPQIEVYKNYTAACLPVIRESGTIISKFHSKMNNDGFRDILSSYACRNTEDIYASLKYELDGYYHIMKNGEIKFVFNQEYDSENLKFNLYNGFDALIKTENDFPAITTTNGENYITIDVSDDIHCIGQGMFYLEVINSKKEKFYLRFYNDYTNNVCDPDPSE